MNTNVLDSSIQKPISAFNRSTFPIYLVTLIFYSVIYMMMVVLPIHLKQLNLNNIDIGFVMGITMIATMFCRPFAGKLIDLFNPYRIAIISLAIFPLILLLFFVPHLQALNFMRILIGITSALFSSAMSIIIIHKVDDCIRGKGMSFYSLASVLPTTFGPAIAFSLLDMLSIEQLFIGFIGLSLLNFVMIKKFFYLDAKIEDARVTKRNFARNIHKTIVSLRQKLKGNVVKKKTTNHDMLQISFQGKNSLFFRSTITILLVSIAHGAIFTFLPLFLLKNDLPHARIYFLVQTIVLVIARFSCSQYIDKYLIKQTRMVILALCGLTAIGTFIIAQSTHLSMLLSAAVLNGIAFSSLYPVIATKLSFNLAKESLGFWMSIFIGAADLGFALGAMLMGYVVEYHSYELMFQICSVFSLIAGLIYTCIRANFCNQ